MHQPDRGCIQVVFFLYALLIFTSLSAGMPAYARVVDVPAPLKPWREWVLHDFDYVQCPFLYQTASVSGAYDCIWVNTTSLKVDERGVDFTVNAELFAERWLSLPGNDEYWPVNVTVQKSGRREVIPVRAVEGQPQILLPSGKHQIHGQITWHTIPANLAMPSNSGLVSLQMQGKQITKPEIDNAGQLWLKKSTQENKLQERDSQKIQVFRLLRDDNPATLVTRVVLDISGAAREIETGEILLADFVPLSLESSLPARIENNKNLRVQVKPGRWEIELVSRYTRPLNSISFNAGNEFWPQTELWAFVANRSLRTVQLEGGQSVDPRQTNLPPEWADYPAYRLNSQQVLNLYEVHRGDPNPEADALSLVKKIFLDFDGAGYTFSDEITGQVNQSWRLNTAGKYQLGNASLNGKPQLITYSPEHHTEGLEIRQGDIQLHAAGRHPFKSSIHVSGWNLDFDSVNAKIYLPPGWSLFASVGIDKVVNSWLSKWSLLDIFLVLIIVVAVFRLCGILPATLALVTLLLLYHRTNAPIFIWLNIVGVVALMGVTEGKLHLWLRRYQLLSFAILTLLLLPFSVQQIREAIYPQLAHTGYHELFSFQTTSETPQQHDDFVSLSEEASVAEVDEIVVTGARQSSEEEYEKRIRGVRQQDLGKVKLSKESLSSYSTQQDFDPNAIVQTGPGLPTWRWKTASLSWAGPIAKDEKMKLFFAPPWLNRVGNVLAVIASILFALVLLQKSRLYPKAKWLSGVVQSVGLIVIFGAGSASKVDADVVISENLLKDLQQRLTEQPQCAPQCVSIAQTAISAKENGLTISMTVDAVDDVAFALPAWRQYWLPQTVTLVRGNRTTPATVKLNHDGQLMVRLAKGRHQLQMQGILYGERIELPFGIPAHNVSLNLDGWEVSGVKDGLAKTGSIQLARVEKNIEVRDVLLPDPVPPFVKVKRKLLLGLEWNVVTTVSRVAPMQGALSVKIPLLDGESPITDVTVEDRMITVDFSSQQQFVQWKSILEKQDTIELKAQEGLHWSEIWELDASPIWHVKYSGIAPIKLTNSLHSPVWQPWTGEQVSIAVERPAAVEGKSLTVDAVNVQHELGVRSNTTDVSFKVRTSRGQDFSFNLPEKAVFESLHIDGQAQPLRQLSNKIEIPLRPGEQFIQLKWRSDNGVDVLAKIPSINFEEEINNIQIKMNLPYDRWPLFVGGPLLGPAVLLWGILIVVAIVALVLARIPLTPLRFHDWLLLGIGIVSTNVFTPVFIAAWFFVLGWRGKYLPRMTQAQFYLVQVFLFLFSFLALVSLVSTIPAGLLSRPDMHIVGNNSTAYALQWYQDRSDGMIDQAWVVSFPLYVYRLAMLGWSLWLAVVLLRWLKWGWLQLNADGLWQYDKAVPKKPSLNKNNGANKSSETADAKAADGVSTSDLKSSEE
ncbi:hypothetical protein TDB9533_02728 [Thalassocella blandensis]|nr:hypothetical protein TDB9533_02728 [Thalassocella blandensis]